jgi:hypothetical protein
MQNKTTARLLEVLKKPTLAFSEKLRLISRVTPQLDAVSLVQALSVLIGAAAEGRASYNDLNALCEAGDHMEMLHDYLRAFFQQGGTDERRVEMARRLEEIVSFRMSQNTAREQDRKLGNTLAEYLLRARN